MSARRGHSLWSWLQNNALWLSGLGLMLASSGIDGAYMSRWMPDGAAWLGLVLNTVSDLAGMVLSYEYGRLRHDNAKSSKRYKMAGALLGAEFVAIAYSWFFSWRQLRMVLTWEPEWVAVAAAGFVPLLLAAIGWAQALLSEPAEAAQAPRQPAPPVVESAQPMPEPAPVAQVPAYQWANLREFRADWDALRERAPRLRELVQAHGNKARAFREWCAELRADVSISDSTARNWCDLFLE